MIHILVYNQKGGAGKTNTVIGLAGAFAKSGASVQLLDGDPQGTLGKWWARRDEQTRIAMTYDRLDMEDYKTTLKGVATRKPDYILTDSPPGTYETHADFIRRADLIVIPVPVALEDYLSTTETLNFIGTVLKEEARGRTMMVPIFRESARSGVRKEILDQMKRLSVKHSCPVFDREIPFCMAPRQRAFAAGEFYQDAGVSVGAPYEHLATFIRETRN